MKLYQKIEIVGLTVLLLSLWWELFIVPKATYIVDSAKYDLLHSKLDQIHYRQRELADWINNKFYEQQSGQKVADPWFSEKWNPTPDLDTIVRISEQEKYLKVIRVIMFFLGSIFLILAKAIEYSSTKAN